MKITLNDFCLILFVVSCGSAAVEGCGGCDGLQYEDAACSLRKTRARSRSVSSWWGRRRTYYYVETYDEDYCCEGYTLEDGICRSQNAGCGGCTGSTPATQTACTDRRVSSRVQYFTSYYSCGWFRTCSRSQSRTVYFETTRQYCCDGFRLSGELCDLIPTVPPTPTTTTTTVTPVPAQCGTRAARFDFITLIVGGSSVTYGELPWLVSLRVSSLGHRCGGTIISDRWILTAAHCIQYQATAYDIRAGEFSRSSVDSHERNYDVMRTIKHPNYHPVSLTDDIALVQTASPIQFNDYVRPACLPSDSSLKYVGAHVQISGWGQTAAGGRTDPASPSDEPRKGNVIIEDWVVGCQTVFGTTSDRLLCVTDGGEDKDIAACFGDSGGPMVFKEDRAYTVMGVAAVTAASGCAMGNPFGYTNVAPYSDWIRNQMNDYS